MACLSMKKGEAAPERRDSSENSVRNKIFGGIGILWGGAILVRWLMAGTEAGNSAYQTGQNSAVIFGALLLAVGAYYFFKKPPAG